MSVKIQLRRDTKLNWSTVNPILALAEIGVETDANLYGTVASPLKFKIGDGVTVWNTLPYYDKNPKFLASQLGTLIGDDRIDANAIKNIPTMKTTAEIIMDLESLTGDARLDAKSIKNLPDASTVSVQVAANTAEINRIRTIVTTPEQVFTYRGGDIPTFPTDVKYKAYYVSFFGLRIANQNLFLPNTTTPLSEGTVLCVDNNDINDSVILRPPVGQTIGFGAIYTVSPNNVVFLVKKAANWHIAFEGYIPANLVRMLTDIKVNMPNELNTMDEIQAALKDRLHTFREIQSEFTDYLHTFDAIESNMVGRGFAKSGAVSYGLSDQPTLPTDNAWIIGHMNPNEEILIPSKGGQKYVILVVPTQLEAVVQTVKINGLDAKMNTLDYVQNELKYKMLISADKIDSTLTIRLEVLYGVDANGMSFDDGLTEANGINYVMLQNGIITTYPGDPKKIDITTSVLFKQETGQDLKATSILTQLPLRAINNPAVVGNVVLDIVPGTFEEIQDDNYLAHFSSDVEISKSKINPNDEMIPAAMWFDDVQSPVGNYINLDRNTKSFSIEETDNFDPNLSNGEKYFVGVYLPIEGNAQNDCIVNLYLKNRDTGEIVVDANKNPCMVSGSFKTGDAFWFMSLNILILAKGQQNIQVCISHNNNTPILIRGINYGFPTLLIQQMKKGTISPAFIQYEAITNHDIRLGRLDLNVLQDTAYEFSKPIVQEIVNANTKIDMADGFHFFANSAVKYKIENGSLNIVSRDNQTPVLFEVGWIIDNVVMRALRGKSVHTDHIVTLPTVDMNIGMYKWIGQGKPTFPIIFSMDSATGQITYGQGWIEVATSNIVHDAAKQEDTTTFSIPNDAENVAFIIYPNRKMVAFEMTLQKFAVVVDQPFTDYIVVGIENSAQKHFVYSDSYAKFRMLQVVPFQWTRYTINLADTKIPVGIKSLGLAPIKNVKAWSDSDFPGEGSLQFDKDGAATITTKLQMGIGEAIQGSIKEEFVKFWYAKQNSDKTFTKIDESETTFHLTLTENYPKFYTMKEFKYDVKKDEILWLFAKNMVADDGSFVYSPNGVNSPLVEIEIYFEETIPAASDPSVNEIRFIQNGTEVFNKQLKYDINTGKMTVTEVI